MIQQKLTLKSTDFLKTTLVFSAIGIFTPGFTAFVLLGFQMMLSSFGLACHKAWTVIWTISIIGALLLPVLYCRHIQTTRQLHKLMTRLIFFNLIEYILLQASLVLFFTNGQTLCYVTDGQNGLELVFTAWLALPILILFSFLFGLTYKAIKDEKTIQHTSITD